MERLAIREDGMVEYELKLPWRDGGIRLPTQDPPIAHATVPVSGPLSAPRSAPRDP